MKIVVIGAGQVGSTVVEALHDEHDITVVDLDEQRLAALAERFDAAVLVGNGASRRTLEEAGVRDADLLIACTSRDEINIIAAIFSKKIAPETKTVVRTTNEEYLEIWHERELDFDLIVSSERETALAVSGLIGVPAARQTDVFADGQVQIVEFDVDGGQSVIGVPLREAEIPPDSKVASIIRGDSIVVPAARRRSSRATASSSSARPRRRGRGAGSSLRRGGGSKTSWSTARAARDSRPPACSSSRESGSGWSSPISSGPAWLPRSYRVRASSTRRAWTPISSSASASTRRRRSLRDARRREEPLRGHARQAAWSPAHDRDRPRRPLDRGFRARRHRRRLNPRLITAEEIVRFAHDPRTRQVAMLEGDRYEILDIVVRPESELLGTPFRELPRRAR